MKISDTQAQHLLDAYFQSMVKEKICGSRKTKNLHLKAMTPVDFRRKALSKRIINDMTEHISRFEADRKEAVGSV